MATYTRVDIQLKETGDIMIIAPSQGRCSAIPGALLERGTGTEAAGGKA